MNPLESDCSAASSGGKLTHKERNKLFSFIVSRDDCEVEIANVIKYLRKITDQKSWNAKEVLTILSGRQYGFIVKKVDGKQIIEATTQLKLCDSFKQSTSCQKPNCPHLHICRHFLEGVCKYAEKCNKTHSFADNKQLLTKHNLGFLSETHLTKLFKKVLHQKKMKHASESSDAPLPCSFYNKGTCKNGDKCKFLHVCQHFVDSDCKFGDKKCKRDHHFQTNHSKSVLAAHGYGHLYNKKQILSILGKSNTSDSDSDSDDSSEDDDGKVETATSKSVEKSEICGFHLRGTCKYGQKCTALHSSMPYQWQYCEGKEWKNWSDAENLFIEKAFCNYKEIASEVQITSNCSINFETMESKKSDSMANLSMLMSGQVSSCRRLSTVSSILAAPGHVYCTEWKWYWLDEHNYWSIYDNGTSDTTSEKIEEQFLSETDMRKLCFTNGTNHYEINMEDPKHMYQINLKFGTKRPVRRRPAKFVDKAVMKQMLEDFKSRRKMIKSSGSLSSDVSLPNTWASQDLTEEFKEITLDKVVHGDEFQRVETLFLKTLPNSKVHSIKRVQNPDLWMDYERQKSKIAKKNAGIVPVERWLFHGTSEDTVGPICQQGFDWRLCGKNGTRYGKGSYFARDASYSSGYCKQSTSSLPVKQMFMANVIVGSYVIGDHNTQRPPQRNPDDPFSVLHDSCVNNLQDPSIFVVFERSQAYPHYIIQYSDY